MQVRTPAELHDSTAPEFHYVVADLEDGNVEGRGQPRASAAVSIGALEDVLSSPRRPGACARARCIAPTSFRGTHGTTPPGGLCWCSARPPPAQLRGGRALLGSACTAARWARIAAIVCRTAGAELRTAAAVFRRAAALFCMRAALRACHVSEVERVRQARAEASEVRHELRAGSFETVTERERGRPAGAASSERVVGSRKSARFEASGWSAARGINRSGQGGYGSFEPARVM